MYQDCGTWSTSPLTPPIEWTYETAVRHGQFLIKSTSPLENAILRVSDRRKTALAAMSVNKEYAFSSGLMDLVAQPHPPYGDYLSPLEHPPEWTYGLSTSEVIL